MNWKKIAKHVFFAPLYAAIIAAFGFMFYVIYEMSIEIFSWIASDWLINVPIVILSVWGIAIVAAIMYKAGLFDA